MTDETTKSRLSRLAVAALIVPFIHWIIVWAFYIISLKRPEAHGLLRFTWLLFYALPCAGIYLSCLAAIRIRERKGTLQGYPFAIAGFILTITLTIASFIGSIAMAQA